MALSEEQVYLLAEARSSNWTAVLDLVDQRTWAPEALTQFFAVYNPGVKFAILDSTAKYLHRSLGSKPFEVSVKSDHQPTPALNDFEQSIVLNSLRKMSQTEFEQLIERGFIGTATIGHNVMMRVGEELVAAMLRVVERLLEAGAVVYFDRHSVLNDPRTYIRLLAKLKFDGEQGQLLRVVDPQHDRLVDLIASVANRHGMKR